MSINRRLLTIIGRRFPAVYDIIPRGPLGQRLTGRLLQEAVSPQPIPPHELGAALAVEFAHSVWLADRLGLDPGRIFSDLELWCPTVPRGIKLPPWWPPIPEPEPQPDWFIDIHLGFAAQLATVASQFENSQLGQSLEKAIERSLGAIESASG